MEYSKRKSAARMSKVFLETMVIVLLCALLMPAVTMAKKADDESGILTKFSTALANVAEQVKPAIVNIATSKTVKTQRHPFFDDPLFKRFFGEGQNAPQKRKVSNLGSGVLATADGYILTCNHVIKGAEDILVKLTDNREYKGTVVGSDERSDIAVIKIAETNLPTIPWADSDKLRVGEVVLAIGQPYGLKQTVTMGIISALGRVGLGISDYEDFIQTDAAINPGNSGGALVNAKGELIGINNAIFSTSGGYQGIGFAIPSNMLRSVMESIITQGKVVRGWLGVQIQPLNAELAKQFNLKEDKGALLADVVDGGPAEKGGLKRGDIIIEYDGKKIDGPFQLKNMVASTRPGKEVKIKIIRDGKPLTLTLTIGELPADLQALTGEQIENALKGVSVQDLSEEILQSLNITKKIKGVIVNNVDEESPSAGILTKGDIITEVNRKPIANAKEYNSVISTIQKNETILLTIVREGAYQFITIPVQ
ncbi:MAG: DegQ family serine endoprotease [Dissulfurispiraceae bacterium]